MKISTLNAMYNGIALVALLMVIAMVTPSVALMTANWRVENLPLLATKGEHQSYAKSKELLESAKKMEDAWLRVNSVDPKKN